jgi:hyperosmotically inducible periplasmic protein
MNLIRSKIVAAASPLVLAVVLCSAVAVFGQDQSTPAPSTTPDNTAKNKHHKVTADQQTNAAGDRDLTAQIRRSIIADKSLSLYAHNVKIITINGMVTLKGPVKSDAEKQTVADLAAKAAGGQEKVTNNITVKQ